MNITKRLLASLLLVCMLVSYVVPATFAENDQNTPIVYDFRLYANAALLAVETNGAISTKNTTFNTAYDGTNRVYNWVVANYGTLGWGYENANGTNSTANKSFEFRNSGNSNQGMRMLIPNAGQWAAIRIHVPVAGTYAIEAAAVQTDLAYTADMYIFPATTEYTSYNNRMSAGDISSRMVSDNKAGKLVIGEGDQATARISDGYRFPEAGDYVVVFAAPEGGIGNTKGAHLGAMALLPVEVDANETTVPAEISGTDVQYQFNLLVDHAEHFGSYASPSNLTKVKKLLASLYPTTVNWNYENSTNGTDKIQLRSNQGLRLYGAVGDWQAFRLSGITTGTYDITLNSEGVSNMNTVSAYLVKAEDNGDIAEKITSENLLLPGMKKTGTYTANQISLEDGEYFLVISHTAAGSTGYWCMMDLALKAVENVPEETTVPVEITTPEETTDPVDTTAPEVTDNSGYKFNLHVDYAEYFGQFPSPSYLTRVKDELAALYPATVNWNYETGTNGTDKIQVRDNQGLRLNGAVGDWQAFRLSGMTAGNYQFTLSSQGNSSMNTVSAYLMKAAEGANPADGMIAENLLFADLRKSGSSTTVFAVPEDGEYFLIIRHTAVGNSGYWCLTALDMEATTEEPTPTTPPETTAPTEPTEPFVPSMDTNGIFDFNLVSKLPELFGGMDGRGFNQKAIDVNKQGIPGDNGKDMSTLQYLDKLYSQKYLDWNYEASSFRNGKGLANIQFRIKQGLRIYGEEGDWIAFRLNVPVADTYNLLLTCGGSDSNNKANIYLTEAAEGMDIANAMCEENLLVKDVKTASRAAIVQEKKLEAKEYILIVMHTTVGKNGFWTLDQLALEKWIPKTAKPAVDKKIYNFDLMSLDSNLSGKTVKNSYGDGSTNVKAVMQKMYNADKIQWLYENSSDSFSEKQFTFREGCFRLKGTANTNTLENPWMAFRLDTPGTATYDIRLVSSDKGLLCANIYLIPAPSTMTLTTAQIEAGMTEENLLVSKALVDDEGTFYLGEYTFGNDEEYILVFNFVKGSTLYLNRIEMTKDGLVADGTVNKVKTYNGTVYDLDLADQMDGIYTKSLIYMPDVYADMNARWAAGTLNWKFYNASVGLSGETTATKGQPTKELRFYRTTGMRVYSKPNNWVALKIKSPGSGDFTISLNHATCANSGTIAMYVLSADTDPEKLWEATDPENRVGKVLLANDTGSTKVVDGATSFVGYWNFEAGKEYILLLECYEASPYNAKRSYMHLSQIVMERGIIDYGTAEEEKKVKPVVVADDALPIADACTNGALAEINGHDWYFLPVEGGYMLVYDLDTGKLMEKVYTGIPRATEVLVTKDQKVVLAAASSFVYDPYTGESYKLANWNEVPGLEETNAPECLCMGEDGAIMWMGSTYGAHLAKYNFETKEYTYLGQPFGYQNRIGSLNYRDGYLYGTTGGRIFKWDTNTNQVVAELPVSEYVGSKGSISTMNFLGDKYIVVGGTYMAKPLVVDLETFQPVDLGMYAHPNLGVTEEIDGKHYMVLEGYGLYEYDIATETVSKIPGFDTSGIGFRTCGQNSYGMSIITKDGESCLMTYTASGGHPRLFNLDKKEYQAWDNLVIDGGGGAPIRTIISWGEGTNRFSFGGFNTDNCAVYNTELGKIEFYYKTGGQTDSHIWYEGKLYAGNYSSTTLNEIYPDETNVTLPATNEVIQRWKLDHDGEVSQKRVHILAAGDGYVFAGTTPNSNLNGGGITVYDTRTGRWKFHRSPVQNGSINGLAYHDKVLFATTSGKGGSGAIQDPDYSGVIFAYDYEKMEVLATLDPRDYIKGLKSPVDIIYGVTADPNVEENGRIWSIVADTLFCFTYDKEAKTFDVQEIVSYGKTTYTNSSSYGWWPRGIQFDAKNSCIYATFAQGGGSRCIVFEDMNAPVGSIKVKSDERFMADIPEGNFYILGEDGNFYYAISEDLKMYPLNLTDEDWNIAQQVDDLILAIGDEITIESETAIKTARSAYENLNWRYKALVQKLELLQEAESDILERKIDTYDGVEMTADHYPEMLELMNVYNDLTSRQQRYVKNYDKLKTAFDAASALNDQRIAAAMQKKIDALQEKFPLTLENEPEVLEVRAEYDSLTAKQSVLVDATILEDAEAQIAVLRAEFVKYVESLIQAIPKEITLEAEPAITAAREAADKLYMTERKDVSYSKLTSAEGKLRTLKSAKAKAEDVDALIDAIGIVTWGDQERIAEARAAYDSLNETALQFVTKGKKLQNAEFMLKALQTWLIPVAVIVIAGVGFAAVMLTKVKKKKEEPTVSE